MTAAGSTRVEQPTGFDSHPPSVSVVLNTYADGRYDAFVEAAESVLAQTYPHVELIVVVDADEELYRQVEQDFADEPDASLYFKPENEGLSAGRNYGARRAAGEIVAFTDDDVVADPDWVSKLVATYERHDALAVGGRADPIWSDGRPAWLPPEFDWLVGATHDGFADGEGEVRNTFGCNISFRRDAFLELDGFRPNLGKRGETSMQGEEAELCARLSDRYGAGVIYTPDAVVGHRVFDHQTEPAHAVERAFWQGYSKWVVQAQTPDSTAEEAAFLAHLVGESIPRRLRALRSKPTLTDAVQLLTIPVLAGAVGLGYLYGFVRALRSDVSTGRAAGPVVLFGLAGLVCWAAHRIRARKSRTGSRPRTNQRWWENR